MFYCTTLCVYILYYALHISQQCREEAFSSILIRLCLPMHQEKVGKMYEKNLHLLTLEEGRMEAPLEMPRELPRLNRNMPKQCFFDGEHQSSIQRSFKLIDPICLSRNGYHISYLEGGRFLCARFPEKKLVLLVVGGLSFCLKNISHSPFMKKKHWCFRIKGFFLPLSFKK